eukprot:TRINITY_DN102699_c0_g1_i1.p1 TRINITY_DN102699_c0_g1~~TRINITY_DN102699_c0_g1_i1.p1  ORF type:complete len:749 (-),score=143.05 TRINITY_DN102699_c0_g1_i1:99-2150(-)
MPSPVRRPSQAYGPPRSDNGRVWSSEHVASQEQLRRRARIPGMPAANRETSVQLRFNPNAPGTPAVEYREIRKMPVTPNPVHCEVRSSPRGTPQVEHREVRRAVPSSGAMPVQVAASPVLQHRQVMTSALQHPQAQMHSVASNLQLTGLPVQHTWNPHGHRVGVAQPQAFQENSAGRSGIITSTSGTAIPMSPAPIFRSTRPTSPPPAANQNLEKIAPPLGASVVDLADLHGSAAQQPANVDFIPASPPNALVEYLSLVYAGRLEPAMCQAGVSVDPARYWDKRRVQGCVRRVLESFQDWAEQQKEKQQSMLGTGPDSACGTNLAGEMFSSIAQCLYPHHAATASSLDSIAIDQDQFIAALERLGAWPPELSPADRAEVFVALMVPTMKAVRRLRESQEPFPSRLTRTMLADGLVGVPFVLPDFPVPVHQLKVQSDTFGSKEVAHELARRFADDGTGLDQVKDFYMTGLLSLEELQVALPWFVRVRQLEEAIELILQTGGRYFTQADWHTFVYSLRGSPAEAALVAAEELSTVPSPSTQHRQHQDPSTSQQDSFCHDDEEVRHSTLEARCATAAATEPMPTRDVRSEQPVMFQHQNRVIDWNTAGMPSLSRSQADQEPDKGAGPEEPAAQILGGQEQSAASSDETFRLISLDWHNECMGPFLACAFVRCCQIYKERELALQTV